MLDEYQWGDVNRINPEAPVLLVDIYDKTYAPGGAANTANNVISLNGNVYVAGIIGDDNEGEKFKKELTDRKISLDGIFVDDNRPTITKTRIVSSGQQLIRADHEKKHIPYNPEIIEKLINYVNSIAGKVDALIISDYAKGTITEHLTKEIQAKYFKQKKPIIIDPKPKEQLGPGTFDFYRFAKVITPNLKETGILTGIDDGIENLDKMIKVIREGQLFPNVLITKGSYGMTLVDRVNGETTHISTKARKVFDITGAGDTVVGTVALAMAAGANLKEAAILANYAAGIVVGKVGTATTTVEEIKSLLD